MRVAYWRRLKQEYVPGAEDHLLLRVHDVCVLAVLKFDARGYQVAVKAFRN